MGEKAWLSLKKRCWHSKNAISKKQNLSFRPLKIAQNGPRRANRCSRLSFGVPKKRPQRHENKNSCSRSSFWPLNGHLGGPRGAKKSTFTTCLSRIYKRPKNRSIRLRDGNVTPFLAPHLARGTSIIESKNHSIQESKKTPGHNLITSRSQRITSHDIKVSKWLRFTPIQRYNEGGLRSLVAPPKRGAGGS